MSEAVHDLYNPAVIQSEFNSSMENIPNVGIYTINPDEYRSLARLSHEEARSLPDGLYLVDESIRDRLEANGITYDSLNRGVLRGVNGEAGTDEAAQLKVGRQNSAHQVFFGTMQFETSDQQTDHTQQAVVAIKRHRERGEHVGVFSAKPYHEIGNLALLKEIGIDNTYKPLGVLQKGDFKYVLTEFMPGIRTLDNHAWYGKKNTLVQTRELTPEERTARHDRDVEIVSRVFDMFGALHAQGVFHGDAQAKNIGWTNNIEPQITADNEDRNSVSDIDNITITVVDLENGLIFTRANNEFSSEYYSGLADLAYKDIQQFIQSVPSRSRLPMGKSGDDPQVRSAFIDQKFINPYINSFIKQRGIIFGEEKQDATLEIAAALKVHIQEKMQDILRISPERSTAY